MTEDDLDRALQGLGSAAVHPRLRGSSEIVFARAAARAEPGVLRAVPLALVAMFIGVAAAGIPGAPVEASPTLALFGPAAPLAPSTLLAAE